MIARVYASLARAAGNTAKPNKNVRRTAKLAVLSMAFGSGKRVATRLPSDYLTRALNNTDWMTTVRAKVKRVEGGYGLWLYRTSDGARLPFNRLVVRRLITGISFHADGTREIRTAKAPWPTIGDALRAQRLYVEGNLGSANLTDWTPHD